jgi:hypothetical protein
MTVVIYGPTYRHVHLTTLLALEGKGVAYRLHEVDTLVDATNAPWATQPPATPLQPHAVPFTGTISLNFDRRAAYPL